MKDTDLRFATLGRPRNIWAISAIHGDIERLVAVHDDLLSRIAPGDRIVYLGNYTGYGKEATETVDEILTFRRLVLSIPGMKPDDLIYLRGVQEELWQKLLQLQFAPDPSAVLLWMLGKGLAPTLNAYGLSPHDGITAAQEGVMSLTRWTNAIRKSVRAHAGHDVFATQLRRAAYTPVSVQFPLLFVHSGLDPHKNLTEQGDIFWWGAKFFDTMQEQYKPFARVIRGYDPAHVGVNINCVTASIDGGCGFGGKLVAACFTPEGEIEDMLEA